MILSLDLIYQVPATIGLLVAFKALQMDEGKGRQYITI
jgi:hypothetical protein